MLQDWFSDAKWNATAENLAARKQLEEIRLRMTAEVNVKLLQSDFSIDTAPMEQLIEALRKAEAEVAEKYFPGESQAVTKYETYTQAVQVASELPGLPAGVLGPYSLEQNAATETVSDFHKEGAAMQKAYEEAGERYETLMTAPRSDLGDSIRKAFSNVDDILTDMSLEKTSENQRAVRILAYNSMEITPENIEKVKEADRQVSAVVDRLTPKNVLQMIRDGVNPLEKTFDELGSYFSQNPESYEEEVEDYSRFLYQLGTEKGCYRRGTKSVYWNLSNGVSGRERGWRSSRRGSKYRCRVAIFHSADGSKKQKDFSYGLESVGGYRADTGDSFVRE